MPIEILMPALSPTMTEGTLARWLKNEGDEISAGDVIAEIETDKATMEVEAVDEGKLAKILVPAASENVPVNKVIALLLEEGEDKSAIDSWLKEYEKAKQVAADKVAADGKQTAGNGSSEDADISGNTDNIRENIVTSVGYQPTKSPDLPPDAAAISPFAEIKASPLAKRLAREYGINLSNIKGTGPYGRIIKEDVEQYLRYGRSSGHVVRSATAFTKVDNNNMRKTIAKRLLEAKQTIPHFYLNIECEIDKLLDVRAQINGAAPIDEESGKPIYKISVNDMIIKASALALRDKPQANASWYDDAIVYYNDVDVAVAVATDGGLITPIIRNADQKTMAQISTEMKRLAARARAGKLQPEEYQGGGFSVSNLGMYGIKSFSAIINPPQSCILAVGAGEQKLVLGESGTVESKTIMNVTLSVDHRSVDGALGAEWLQIFKYYIENPALLIS